MKLNRGECQANGWWNQSHETLKNAYPYSNTGQWRRNRSRIWIVELLSEVEHGVDECTTLWYVCDDTWQVCVKYDICECMVCVCVQLSFTAVETLACACVSALCVCMYCAWLMHVDHWWCAWIAPSSVSAQFSVTCVKVGFRVIARSAQRRNNGGTPPMCKAAAIKRRMQVFHNFWCFMCDNDTPVNDSQVCRYTNKRYVCLLSMVFRRDSA